MEIHEGENHVLDLTSPHYKLYSQKAIDLATLLGTLVAGSFLLAANFRNLGNSNSSRNTVLLGISGFAFYAYAISSLPQALLDVVPPAAFLFLQVAAIHLCIVWKQAEALDRHKKMNGAFHSMWRAAGLSLLVLPLSLAVFFLGSVGPKISRPENVVLRVTYPDVVKQGRNFQIRAHLSNTAASEQTLVYVCVVDELMEGIAIESSEPPFPQSMHVPGTGTMFDYGLVIPPSDKVTITLLASAFEKGDYIGDLDFCINSELTCLYRQLHIRVE